MPGSVPVAPLEVRALQIPHHFRCPISLELMRDPVTVSTGQTYDRASIESWVATGHATCPVTRQPLQDQTLIPNHTLRRLIQEWCVANHALGVERIPTPKQPADPTLIRAILAQAESASSSSQARLSALQRLNALTKESPHNRAHISLAMHDPHPAILLLALHDPNTIHDPQNSDDLVQEAISLIALAPEPYCASVVSNSNHLSRLSVLLVHASLDVRANTAAIVEAALSSGRESRAIIGATDGLIPALVNLLREPLAHPRALKLAVKSLFSLCLAKPNRELAIEAGAASALVERLVDLDRCDAERALATIELLCRTPAGCAAFEAHALAVPLLVKMILKVSDRATESAAGALLAVCATSEATQKEAVTVGVVTQLLLLVQSECTARAKRKAQLLLKLLRDAWPDESVANSDYACSDIVPF
ncbi:U-box domain-containing protein 26 [Amborella trichopoda]|uniref:U-box domain-containing protein n=1 Tax=Amborella trichopoda TaxID=13333 RepID=W1PNG6_AMBTC|nr:U-box domain-containing protein 26 [Amborella trichopoda]ERN08695.1 hypothetical protein AMTR_s00017p00223570 [Amborella trichopoda]|eukprot:XP_006847114.1 U-box domain-containing protein 26 [Amborella trichopoda]